jgi:hypothetical protein
LTVLGRAEEAALIMERKSMQRSNKIDLLFINRGWEWD